jgi:RNA polymerase sigma factor (TIGR02999 family)
MEVGIAVNSGSSKPVTELLSKWQDGDESALKHLTPLVYSELQRLARNYLRSERSNHTLQSTALVHEAYLRLVGQDPVRVESRAHFFSIAARLMRQILVDHARGRGAAKRSGGCRITLDESAAIPQKEDLDVVALNDALDELSGLDEQQAKIVELRFFAGLSIEDTSQVLNISPATVKRKWTTARLWLHRELSRKGH